MLLNLIDYMNLVYYSVGSLGENGYFSAVEEVRVKNCTLSNTMNGVRIKTFQVCLFPKNLIQHVP